MCPKELLISAKACHCSLRAFVHTKVYETYQREKVNKNIKVTKQSAHLQCANKFLFSDFLCHSPTHGAYSHSWETPLDTNNYISCWEWPGLQHICIAAPWKIICRQYTKWSPTHMISLRFPSFVITMMVRQTSFCNSYTDPFSPASIRTKESHQYSSLHILNLLLQYGSVTQTGHLYVTH